MTNSLHARKIYSDASLALIAIESVKVQGDKTNTGGYLYAKMELVAVVISGPGETRALDHKARPMSFEHLKQQVPQLDELLAGYV